MDFKSTSVCLQSVFVYIMLTCLYMFKSAEIEIQTYIQTRMLKKKNALICTVLPYSIITCNILCLCINLDSIRFLLGLQNYENVDQKITFHFQLVRFIISIELFFFLCMFIFYVSYAHLESFMTIKVVLCFIVYQ